MDQIVKPQIKYEVRGEFLYVDGHRYKVDTINSVNISKKYYFGMDDTLGAYECSLSINRYTHHLNFSVLDEESDTVKAEKWKILDDLVADIKRLINW